MSRSWLDIGGGAGVEMAGGSRLMLQKAWTARRQRKFDDSFVSEVIVDIVDAPFPSSERDLEE